MRQPIPRRTFLRGLGTALALPLLDGMMPLRSFAEAAGAQAAKQIVRPNRMLFLFVPNGMHMPDWTPTAEGNFELPWIMEPLKNVKDHLTVLSGLAQNNARALGDGGGDHARSSATWLTGVHPRKTSGADLKAGVSVDQLAAQKIGHLTKFASLEIGVERGAQAGNCDSGYSCAYSSSVSWSSESTPVAKETNPRLVFERLFGNGEEGEQAESRQRRERYKKSILDFVMEDANDLKTQLGARDQRKLDEYFTGVREIEQRLARVEEISNATMPAMAKPGGVPADPGEHIRLMCDMLVLALQSDLTRISTFMLANDGSNRSYRNIGIAEGHHELSHHQGNKEKQDKIRQINRFHVTQLAYLLEKMKSIKEGDGTLLDNSMLVYGAGISDGDRHNHNDLPILLAGGGAGTLKPGRHVTYPDGTPMSNLFLAMLDRVNIHTDSLGDSTGRLEHLF
ncbi:MAG: DUF1552 domain-containing protein [Abitibacteriaceae bacterium]|nr:DUF1552 domain-containing protein [Abditibacteriaceae bacterium]MBV9863717.1 DUF1552 domain-containing protein [Abditibacteriaceae bacterium]